MGGFLNQISTAPQQQQAQPQPQQQPQIVNGQDGQPYVVTPQGYIPLAQWQAMQQPQGAPQQGFQQQAPQGQQQPQGFAPNGQQPQGFAPNGQQPNFGQQQQQQQQQQQGFVPNGQQPNFAPQGQQPSFAPNGQQPNFGQQPQGFAPNGQQPQGFAPNGQQPQGFAPNGAAPGPVAGGFVPAGAPAFGGPQQTTQQPAGFGGWGAQHVPFEQIMSGMGALDGSGRGAFFRGEGLHVCEIQKVKGGLGSSSQMPFFSVELKVLESNNPETPAGAVVNFTASVSNLKYIDSMKKRVKNFMIAVLGSMYPQQQWGNSNVDGTHSAWAIGQVNGQPTEQQPCKGVRVYCQTTEDITDKDGKESTWTNHNFSAYVPNQAPPR